MLPISLLTYALVPALVLARGRGGDGDGGGDNGDDLDDGATNSTAGAASSSSGNVTAGGFSGDLTGLTGDAQCTSLMCISAVVNGSVVEYILQSTGSASLGWMAMGFGSQMANTPMVIMWSNSDGSVTLSQRQAPAEVMPTVVASPPRVATSVPTLSSTSGSQPKFGYSIPANSDTQQSLIWAFGTTNPGSPSVSANLQQHLSSGTLNLDLTKSLSGNDTSSVSNPAASGVGSQSGTEGLAYPLYQKLIIAHAVLLGVGYLILLPFGALLARYWRSFSPSWFKGHWIVQFGLTGPIVLSGVVLGIMSVKKAGSKHLDDTHKKWGLALFILYVVLCLLGGIIHFVKPKAKVNPTTGVIEPRLRPPQNYAHAIIGILTIALAFYQVRTGYKSEWPNTTGRGEAPRGVNIAWIVWVVMMPLLYTLGLFLLPRQFKQERAYARVSYLTSQSSLSDASANRRRAEGDIPKRVVQDNPNEEHGSDQHHSDDHSLANPIHGQALGDPYADDIPLTPTLTSRPTSPRRSMTQRSRRAYSVTSNKRNASVSRSLKDAAMGNVSNTTPSRTPTMQNRDRAASILTLPRSVGRTASTISAAFSHSD